MYVGILMYMKGGEGVGWLAGLPSKWMEDVCPVRLGNCVSDIVSYRIGEGFAGLRFYVYVCMYFVCICMSMCIGQICRI